LGKKAPIDLVVKERIRPEESRLQVLQVFDQLFRVRLVPNDIWVSRIAQLYPENQSHGDNGLFLNVRKGHEGQVDIVLREGEAGVLTTQGAADHVPVSVYRAFRETRRS